MRYYPMFVKLTGRTCLVVGAGEVGRRKIARLLDCGAETVRVIDTSEPAEDLARIVMDPRVTFEVREFRDEDVEGTFLVIASTSSPALNQHIYDLCEERNILCNVVDKPHICSFIVPAVVNKGDFTLAISTGGSSPALAKRMRKELDNYFGSHYGAFLDLMSSLRPLVIERGTDVEANSAIFRALVHSGLLEALEKDDFEAAAHILRRHLPEDLHKPAVALLDTLD